MTIEQGEMKKEWVYDRVTGTHQHMTSVEREERAAARRKARSSVSVDRETWHRLRDRCKEPGQSIIGAFRDALDAEERLQELIKIMVGARNYWSREDIALYDKARVIEFLAEKAGIQLPDKL